jgi:hypothetical protein
MPRALDLTQFASKPVSVRKVHAGPFCQYVICFKQLWKYFLFDQASGHLLYSVPALFNSASLSTMGWADAWTLSFITQHRFLPTLWVIWTATHHTQASNNRIPLVLQRFKKKAELRASLCILIHYSVRSSGPSCLISRGMAWKSKSAAWVMWLQLQSLPCRQAGATRFPSSSSGAHATHHHQWNQGLPKTNAVPLMKKVKL